MSCISRVLKLVTVDGFNAEPPNPPDVFPNLDFPAIPDIGSAPDEMDNNFWDDVLDFILAVVGVLEYLAQVAAYLATLPWAIAADVTTYPWRLAAYYAFILPLFQPVKAFRGVLVMTGYMLPMDDEVAMGLVQVGNSQTGVFTQVLNIDGYVFGGMLPPPQKDTMSTYRDPGYLHSIPLDATGKTAEFRTPWSYPTSVTEMHDTSPIPVAGTTAGPYASGSDPSVLFRQCGRRPEDARPDCECHRTPKQSSRL